jgi:uncharacterized protein YtpQ (UPF0354 family)
MKNPFRKPQTNVEVTSEAELIRTMLLSTTPKDTFFLLYARLIELRLKPGNLTYEEPGILRLTTENGWTSVLYLENLWIRCRDDRETGQETIESYIRTAERVGEEVSVKRETIIPWVKDQGFVDLYVKDSDFARKHLAADLWIVYASQGEGSSSAVANQTMSELGISAEELLPLAIANLRRILPPIEVEDFGGWSLMWAGGDYVPSLLLFDDIWNPIADEMEGDLIAVAPVSDSIFFTSSSFPAAVAHIRRRALALEAEGDHVVSSTLLRRIPGGWTAYD